MISNRENVSRKIKLIFGAVILLVVLLGIVIFFTNIFDKVSIESVPQMIWILAALMSLGCLIVLVAKMVTITNHLGAIGEKLEKINEAVEKSRSQLVQISQNTYLSETAKAIASREYDRQSLRDAVLEKLHQQDFDAAAEIIKEIEHSTVYKELASQLRQETDQYRESGDQEKINQVIEHCEKLYHTYQWGKASLLIEKLIKDYPSSEKVLSMRQKLFDKKQERKKALLNTWDHAVKNQLTDRSIEILKELDQYLTPNEGLAMQEAARDVFRNKLHSMGVRFSLAVSGKQWKTALDAGEEIVKEFPNSKMAEEIREKLTVLRQKVEQVKSI